MFKLIRSVRATLRARFTQLNLLHVRRKLRSHEGSTYLKRVGCNDCHERASNLASSGYSPEMKAAIIKHTLTTLTLKLHSYTSVQGKNHEHLNAY